MEFSIFGIFDPTELPMLSQQIYSRLGEMDFFNQRGFKGYGDLTEKYSSAEDQPTHNLIEWQSRHEGL